MYYNSQFCSNQINRDMDRTNHHGRHSFLGKNKLCSINHYNVEKIGKFGRIFREGFSPLYTKPSILEAIGKKGGIMDGGDQDELTKTVPLGMIFFGQFIDHDITFDTTSSLSSANTPENIDNVRTPVLDLDSLFGSGPEDQPYLYRGGKEGFRLHTGGSNDNIGQGKKLESQDLPRNGSGIALIGDPRNDENTIISQFHLLMIKFYNKIYDKVESENPNLSSHDVFEEARKSTVLHYQWLVLNHFLPLICGAHVVKDILANGRKYYVPIKESFIPVEFSVAAYRFGHSMIRQKMKLNNDGKIVDIFSAQFGRGFSRLKSLDQVIDWDLFFDTGTEFQKAAKCDVKLPTSLLALPFIPAPNNSLATRNLKRGNSFLLPSGEAVSRSLGRTEKEIELIQNNLALHCDTPLWLYLLAEAQYIGRQDQKSKYSPNEGLGPVGARIVAEVLIGILQLDSNSFLGSNPNWSPNIGEGEDFQFKDLIAFVN